MADEDTGGDINARLKPGASFFLGAAGDVQARFGHQALGLRHYLLALLERYAPMAESLAVGLHAGPYRQEIEEQLSRDEIGAAVTTEELVHAALELAKLAGKEVASERDIAALLLERAGWTLVAGQASFVADPQTANVHRKPALAATPGDVGDDLVTAYRPRARFPTPLLEQLGRDLCHEADQGKLAAVLGREVELQGVMETLCRWTKRNPLLVGPAGIGKTAIVEALAQRIVRGEVPPPLQRTRIFALQTSALVRNAGVVGQLEERMETIVKEAGQDGIILFIDEIHTVVGSGGAKQLADIGSLLKPALAAGSIACIGATTDAEFRAFIEQDRALERRFQPLRIQELSAEATLEILEALRARAATERDIVLTDGSLQAILQLSQQYLRNRHFPDKAIDILEQSVAYALINKVGEVTPRVVRDVVERMMGVPVDLGTALSERLQTARERLVHEAFCPAGAAEQVVRRLEVTMRGLDVSPARPNAVLFAAGSQGQAPELTALVLAEALYGSRGRLIEVDMTRFSQPATVAWLTGAPPGYVGHEQALSFHLELAQKPWSVLHLKNVEDSHYLADELLAQAVRDGFFTDAQGRRIYLSDAVVLLTATVSEGKTEPGRPLGFAAGEGAEEGQKGAGAPADDNDLSYLISPALWEQVDVAWALQEPSLERLQTWVERWALPPVGERYRTQGLEIEWDASVVRLLAAKILDKGDLLHGERFLEAEILPLLIPHLSISKKVMMWCDESGVVQVQAQSQGG